MSPITHLLISWSVANACGLDKKDRTLVTLAGIAPDIDGAGLVMDVLGHDHGRSLEWWRTYHHVLGHNIGLGIFLTISAFAIATRRWRVGFIVMISFHLHLLGDLVGSMGPDGYQWPIPYLLPFFDAWQWAWSGQWALNAWPNFMITGIALWIMFYFAWKKGVSPLEMISTKANSAFVDALHRRFGDPAPNRI